MAEREPRGESFVVWLDPGQTSECRGRVEHVSTSKRARFTSADELIEFLRQNRRGTTRPAGAARPVCTPGSG